jgi:hypothetical protein
METFIQQFSDNAPGKEVLTSLQLHNKPEHGANGNNKENSDSGVGKNKNLEGKPTLTSGFQLTSGFPPKVVSSAGSKNDNKKRTGLSCLVDSRSKISRLSVGSSSNRNSRALTATPQFFANKPPMVLAVEKIVEKLIKKMEIFVDDKK